MSDNEQPQGNEVRLGIGTEGPQVVVTLDISGGPQKVAVAIRYHPSEAARIAASLVQAAQKAMQDAVHEAEHVVVGQGKPVAEASKLVLPHNGKILKLDKPSRKFPLRRSGMP